jgi:pimeloyl-ACP methyl ester carboxylesterase
VIHRSWLMHRPSAYPAAMERVTVAGLEHSYELRGEGPPVVFVHGAFVDSRMWDRQVEVFAQRYRVLRYDLRGHGRTGPSDRRRYRIDTFADDLAELLDALGIGAAAIVGLSLGGMIAQSFAVRHPERVRALVLADTAVSVSLTLSDMVQRYLLFPYWAMWLTIRLLGARRFTSFSFWLARVTRSARWFGHDEATRRYVEACMVAFDDAEYLKVYGAIYAFTLLPLERITAPTLVLNGEHESRSVFRHTEEVLRRVPGARAEVLPEAGHTSNMENPEAFDLALAAFLRQHMGSG